VDLRVLGHEARDAHGQSDDGSLVQGRSAEAVQDFPGHGPVQHGANILFFQDADARCHVRKEFHEAPARADHGHGAEARVLGGPDEDFLAGFDHGLDQDAIDGADPGCADILHEPVVTGLHGALVGKVQQHAAQVRLVDDFAGDGLHGHRETELPRRAHGLLPAADHATQDGDAVGVQKNPALFESELGWFHVGVSLVWCVRIMRAATNFCKRAPIVPSSTLAAAVWMQSTLNVIMTRRIGGRKAGGPFIVQYIVVLAGKMPNSLDLKRSWEDTGGKVFFGF